MEQQEAVDRRCLEQFLRERDNLRAALDQERRLHENDDEDMRKKLKVIRTIVIWLHFYIFGYKLNAFKCSR